MESPYRIEPCLFDDQVPGTLADLASEIQNAAAAFEREVPNGAAHQLAELVRVMNGYYSNLIEGHNTRPVDIERALAGAEIEPERRSLALEARAHVIVQRKIDADFMAGRLPVPTSVSFLRQIHADFYREMPPELATIHRPDGSAFRIFPGSMRTEACDDVAVGRHVPPSGPYVHAFMSYFEKRFGAVDRQANTRIIAMAAAHHRMNYIHPFPDGNGRVSRLMSHAMALRAGLGVGGMWSISRGLARGLKDRGEYKIMMDHADTPRCGDRDGRGNLSEAALREFTTWFLSVMLDQLKFMRTVFDLGTLEDRYLRLLSDLGFPARLGNLVTTLLRFGALPRGDSVLVMKVSDRTARNDIRELVEAGFLQSASPKGPVHLAFPLAHRERLFPSLFTTGDIKASPAV